MTAFENQFLSKVLSFCRTNNFNSFLFEVEMFHYERMLKLKQHFSATADNSPSRIYPFKLKSNFIPPGMFPSIESRSTGIYIIPKSPKRNMIHLHRLLKTTPLLSNQWIKGALSSSWTNLTTGKVCLICYLMSIVTSTLTFLNYLPAYIWDTDDFETQQAQHNP